MSKPQQKPNRVLFLITKSNWGGAQRYVFDLATSLKKHDYDVSVGLGGTGEPEAPIGILGDKLTATNIPFSHLTSFTRAVSFGREFRAAADVWKCLRSNKPDIVHLNSSKAAALGAFLARIRGVKKIVFTVHGFPYDSQRPAWQQKLIRLVTTLTFWCATDIICICTPDYKIAQTYSGTKNKLHLIPNGIATSTNVEPTARVRARFIESFPELAKLSPATKWLATGTELIERKGIQSVIAACQQLPESTPPYHLFIIGTGTDKESLQAQVVKANLTDKVTFFGFVDNLETNMTAFDGFILASFKEGLPYTLLELGRSKVPIIASNIDGIPNIIEHNKEGQLIDPYNTEEITAAIANLLKHPNRHREQAGRLAQKITTTFSLATMTEQTMDVYQKP